MQTTFDTCGIDEQPILAIDGDDLIDRISRGARKIVDDGAFLVGQLIEQGGFADVRTSDQSHAAQMRRRKEAGCPFRFLQRVECGVKQFADATTVHGGNAIRLTQTHLPEFGGQVFAFAIIDLVHRKRDWLTRGS